MALALDDEVMKLNYIERTRTMLSKLPKFFSLSLARLMPTVLVFTVVGFPFETAAQELVAGCGSVGDICSDGTIFAGPSPDDGKPMYLAAVDGEGFDVKMGSYWGPTDYSASIPLCVDVSSSGESCVKGKENVSLLVQLNSKLREANGGHDEYQAVMHCENLTEHGHDDWYLPARDELYSVFQSIGSQEQLGMRGSYFWTSSLSSPAHVWAVHFDQEAGDILAGHAAGDMRVRCVRTT